MNCLIVAVVLVVVAVVAFVWVNRNHAAKLDSLEEAIRAFKKK